MARKRNLSERDNRLANLFQRAHIIERSSSKYGPIVEVVRSDLISGVRTVHEVDFFPDYTLTLRLRFKESVAVYDVALSFREYASVSIPGLLENMVNKGNSLEESLASYELGTPEKRTYAISSDKKSPRHHEIKIVSHYGRAENSFLCYIQDVYGINAIVPGPRTIGKTIMQGKRRKIAKY